MAKEHERKGVHGLRIREMNKKYYEPCLNRQICDFNVTFLDHERHNLEGIIRLPSILRLTITSDSTSLASPVDDKAIFRRRWTSLWEEFVHDISPFWVLRIWERIERHDDRNSCREVKCGDSEDVGRVRSRCE